MKTMFHSRPQAVRLTLLILILSCSLKMSAMCGAVDYDDGASALHDCAQWVLTMMQYVVYLLYAIASLLTLYNATVIYIKLNTGEEGLLKPVLVLFGSILFLIASTTLMPAFFGINHLSTYGSAATGNTWWTPWGFGV